MLLTKHETMLTIYITAEQRLNFSAPQKKLRERIKDMNATTETSQFWLDEPTAQAIAAAMTQRVNFCQPPQIKFEGHYVPPTWRSSMRGGDCNTRTGQIRMYAGYKNVVTLMHELAHLDGKGKHEHGPRFQQTLERYMSIWAEIKDNFQPVEQPNEGPRPERPKRSQVKRYWLAQRVVKQQLPNDRGQLVGCRSKRRAQELVDGWNNLSNKHHPRTT